MAEFRSLQRQLESVVPPESLIIIQNYVDQSVCIYILLLFALLWEESCRIVCYMAVKQMSVPVNKENKVAHKRAEMVAVRCAVLDLYSPLNEKNRL